jgi:hypothetical protein
VEVRFVFDRQRGRIERGGQFCFDAGLNIHRSAS